MFDLVADILLVVGAFGAAVYCRVLSDRLQRFNALEGGMGGAIAVLSAQVDEMTAYLHTARAQASGSTTELSGLVARAEAVAARLDVLVASLHDLPEPEDAVQARRVRVTRRRREMETAE